MSNTPLLPSTPAGIDKAAAIIRAGGLVAFATETVYGLGADATNGAAVARIFEAKGRPQFNPLIVHVPDLDTAEKLVELPDNARMLAATFWPGPLTIVAPLKADSPIASLVTAGLPTLAIRVPAHPLALDLLRAANTPIAAPSANPSGMISPTTAGHVIAGLDGKIDAILDGGACPVGLESTIISGETSPRLLRAGGLAKEDIQAVLGTPLLAPETGKLTAPGQLLKHYATRTPLALNQTTPGAIHIGFGPGEATLNFSQSGDLREAAANLFAYLHQADAMAQTQHIPQITVAPIPKNGLGFAINDRLTRAAQS